MKYFFLTKKLLAWPVLLMSAILILLLVSFNPCEAAKKSKTPKKAREVEPLTPERLATLDIKTPLFRYDSKNRPDPFHPFINFSQIERTIPPETGRILTPLEKYALNQFYLVGIILAGDNQNYALVEDPEQIGYTVREGDRIGNRSGQVIQIKSNEVIVEEPYLDIFDKQQMRTITLKLREMVETLNATLKPTQTESIKINKN